jgi:uncharacterized protein YutE (UPF0331/DUF86 family)
VVDRDLLTAKVLEFQDRTLRIRSKCPATVDELRTNRDALDLVSFNLMLAVQSCSDIPAIIADEGWPAAQNLASGFNRPRDEGVITARAAETLCRAIGLRNVVAHGYAGVNPDIVHLAARTGSLISTRSLAKLRNGSPGVRAAVERNVLMRSRLVRLHASVSDVGCPSRRWSRVRESIGACVTSERALRAPFPS